MWGLIRLVEFVEWQAVKDVLLGAVAALWLTWHAPNTGRQIVIPADSSNACHTELTSNGNTFKTMLDSGAVGQALVFGSNHAKALGLKGPLSYDHRYGSANGDGYMAIVKLPEVQVFGWKIRDIPASITRAPMPEGLLGAELLHKVNFTTAKGYCVVTAPVS